MPERLRILAIEPYFGGPHADFLEGLRRRSRHEWTLLVMPARRWKWRMHGAAMHLAREAAGLAPKSFDLVFTSDFLNVPAFKALAPEPIARLPVVTYFHENQLSYPLEPGQRRDPQYAFINLSSALASREVWFNSAFHRNAWHAAVRALLAKMPDFVPPDLVETLEGRSRVMPPGMDLGPFAAGRKRPRNKPPLTILWNHRWEFDKNPEAFFEVLFFLAEEGVPFRLAVVGEAMRKWPPVFEKARRRLADRLVRFGYIPKREAYEEQVRQSDIVVSTAFHEFFGVPVVEAIAAGCFPLMPARLSYPEIVPAAWQKTFFYTDEREMRQKLMRLLAGKGPWDRAYELAEHVQRYDWGQRVRTFDDALAATAGRAGS
jgi:glycosyltransferase involved in cell wall biosynthesis